MTDIRAAAERLRIYTANNSRGQPYDDWDYMDGIQDSMKRQDDLEAIADAYLSENPADDSEPITPLSTSDEYKRAKVLVDWMSSQRHDGQEILHAAVCCDFAGRHHFIEQVAKFFVDTTDTMTKIPLPCPLCGNPSSVTRLGHGSGKATYNVSCGASDDVSDTCGLVLFGGHDTRSEMVAKWNRRFEKALTRPPG